jgi:ribokinase
MDALVFGQIARDLVLTVDGVPGPHDTAPVRSRREMLGGKGANQAVGLTQLGVQTGVCGVVGDDEIADRLVEQANRDGVDTSYVIRRRGIRTGLIVDIVTPDGQWRYLEDLPEPVLLTEADVEAAAAKLNAVRAVLVQLQQPAPAALAAARAARRHHALVLLDGAPADDARRDELLASADIVRADDREAPALTGTRLDSVEDAVRAGRTLLVHGVRLVALAVPDVGNVVVWAEGHVCLPLLADEVVDTTGAGDAFIAGLVAALLHGKPPTLAGRYATAAAAVTVAHPGGRPNLSVAAMRPYLERLATSG